MLKKTLKIAGLVIAAALTLSSCKDKGTPLYSLNITLDESSFTSDVPVPESYDVTITNTNTGDTTSVKSARAVISTSGLVAGVYNIVATAQVVAGNTTYNYIGISEKTTIDGQTELKSIPVSVSKASNLIFKEIFYCCSTKQPSGAYIKDNFFEIYNNGSSIQYLDGLCIGAASNHNISTIQFADDNGFLVGIDTVATKLKAADYVMLNGSNQVVWQFPGSGKNYPLNPGESVVIASSAMDHSTVSANLINLSSAEFETICAKYIEKGQVDNEKSINMTLVNPLNQTITNQYLPSNSNAGFCLFAIDCAIDALPKVINIKSPAAKYLAIKKSLIYDAVNWVKNETTDPFLPSDIDAGKIWCSGLNKGESILRVAADSLATGQIIYQDTNNTTKDWVVSTTPTIHRNGAGRPSWAN